MRRLPARTFYGLIVVGTLGGMAAGGLGVWAAAGVTGRGHLGGVTALFGVAVGAMMGGTFGGLAGLAAAVLWDRRRGRHGP